MDTSKEYIEMCEAAASDIQAEMAINDLVYAAKWDKSGTIDYTPKLGGEAYYFDQQWMKSREDIEQLENRMLSLIWLPRQDQLQKLVWGWIDEFGVSLENGKIKFVTYNLEGYAGSFEQMWLMIHMRENKNKLWDHEEKEWFDRG